MNKKNILIYFKNEWYFIILLLFLDQVTKILARYFLSMEETLSFGNLINFKLLYNDGIAFGIFQKKGYIFFVIFLTILILHKFLFNYNTYLFLNSILKQRKILRLFYLLFISGILGNLMDRIFFLQVTDFISLSIIPNFRNYFFNMADIYIFLSIVVIIYCLIFIEN